MSLCNGWGKAFWMQVWASCTLTGCTASPWPGTTTEAQEVVCMLIMVARSQQGLEPILIPQVHSMNSCWAGRCRSKVALEGLLPRAHGLWELQAAREGMHLERVLANNGPKARTPSWRDAGHGLPSSRPSIELCLWDGLEVFPPSSLIQTPWWKAGTLHKPHQILVLTLFIYFKQ